MKKLLLIILAMCMIHDVDAQSFPDMILNKDFAAQVKSIDEFIQRFNGEESHPEVKADNRMLNLIALSDYKMDHEELSDSLFKNKILEFVQTVETSNTKIKLTDSNIYAEVEIIVTLSGKTASLFLLLQSQTYNTDRVRWAIVGVRGLEEVGVIDTKHFYGISPVEHETHFMSIGDIFAHNAPEIMGYRGKDTKIDELSVFMTMAMLGIVRISSVKNLTMHCLDVPNYVFTINEEGRNGQNSGWLISSITRINENKKTEYLSKLLGK